jgi:hypothetical protein
MRIILLAAVMAMAMVPAACFGQNPGGVDLTAVARESAVAAKQALPTLAEMAKGDNAARLGFAVAGDAERSELAAPLSDFIIGLDDLRSWQPSTAPMGLLRPTGLVVYPVKTGGAVRSSVTLKKQDSTWQAVAFGAPAQSQAVAGARAAVTDKAKIPETQTFQVRIPAFNLVFVAYADGNRLMLTPVVDTQRYGLSAGVAVAADQVFARLKPDAERDSGLPR